MGRYDEEMEHEHWEEWGRIRQYEREHPIRDMLEWIVAMFVVGLLTMAFYMIFVVLSFVSTTLIDFGMF